MMEDFFKALFYDDKTGKPSQSKIWTNIGFAAMTYVFVRQTTITAELLFSFGAIVASNGVANAWIKNHYQRGDYNDCNPGVDNPDTQQLETDPSRH